MHFFTELQYCALKSVQTFFMKCTDVFKFTIEISILFRDISNFNALIIVIKITLVIRVNF